MEPFLPTDRYVGVVVLIKVESGCVHILVKVVGVSMSS